MSVELRYSGNTLTAIIEGDIDHHTAKSIRESIDMTAEERQPELLQLDFGGVQFMDSSGIGLIMGRYRLMQLLKGKVEVINMPANIERLVALSGLGALGVIKKGGSKCVSSSK